VVPLPLKARPERLPRAQVSAGVEAEAEAEAAA